MGRIGTGAGMGSLAWPRVGRWTRSEGAMVSLKKRERYGRRGVIGTSWCGPEGTRTPYLVVANDALYQMSYRPVLAIPMGFAVPQNGPVPPMEA